MYFLGTFAAEQFVNTDDPTDTTNLDDLDFFPFPTLGTEFDDELGIDAPIDGFMLSKAPANLDAAKAFLACAATGAAQIIYLTANPAAGVAAGSDADASGYTAAPGEGRRDHRRIRCDRAVPRSGHATGLRRARTCIPGLQSASSTTPTRISTRSWKACRPGGIPCLRM